MVLIGGAGYFLVVLLHLLLLLLARGRPGTSRGASRGTSCECAVYTNVRLLCIFNTFKHIRGAIEMPRGALQGTQNTVMLRNSYYDIYSTNQKPGRAESLFVRLVG